MKTSKFTEEQIAFTRCHIRCFVSIFMSFFY